MSVSKAGSSQGTLRAETSGAAKTTKPAESETKAKKQPQKPSVDSFRERMQKWLKKEIPKGKKNISIDDAMNRFSINETPNGQFQLKCKQRGCSEVFVLVVTDTHCDMSNVHRHITRTCGLSSNSDAVVKPTNDAHTKKSQSTVSQLFCNSAKTNDAHEVLVGNQKNQERFTLHQDVDAYDYHMNRGPPSPNVVDFAAAPGNKMAKLEIPIDHKNHSTINQTKHSSIDQTKHSSIVTSTQSTIDSTPKNLYLPAGHQDGHDCSGH